MNKKVKCIDLGLMDYKQAWDYQQSLFDEIVDIKKENRKSNSNVSTPNYFFVVRVHGSISRCSSRRARKSRPATPSGRRPVQLRTARSGTGGVRG